LREIQEVLINHIEPNNFNPNVMGKAEFEALKKSMINGQKYPIEKPDPILISPENFYYEDSELPNDRYVIIDGEWRWRAAKEDELEVIDSEIWLVTESQAKAINYRRNKERGTLCPIKEAQLFKGEIDCKLTHEQIADKYLVSRSYVSSRITILNLDEAVLDLYRRGTEAFKEQQIAEYERKLEEDPDASEWLDEPDGVPRGTIRTSHLEAIASLPKEKQIEVAKDIMEDGLSVKRTEDRIRHIKDAIEKAQRFEEALKRAKRKKCPKCGSDPDGFYYSDETQFTCESPTCYGGWDYMKTQAEADAEKKEHRTESEIERSEKLKEQFKEAKQNPKYIRLVEPPKQLHDNVKIWVLAKVLQLTEIESINVVGKRGDEEMRVGYEPPDRTRMSLTFRTERGDEERNHFSFWIEEKDYKKLPFKSRVNLGEEPSEEARERLRQFFNTVIKTDTDP